MRVHFLPPEVPSRALDRVADALRVYTPSGVFFTTEEQAEVVVIPVVGRFDRVQRAVDRSKRAGRRYAMIQYVLRSSQKPKAATWLPLWLDAAVIWSYYDLPALLREEGETRGFEFMHAPLGVDGGVFRPRGLSDVRRYAIVATGRGMLTESVKECVYGAKDAGRRAAVLGPIPKFADADVFNDLTDGRLAALYGDAELVSGLRRTEGFELPAAEGALCGTRPLLFDAPHYRAWYDGIGEFIEESPSRDAVRASIAAIIRNGPRRMTNAEQADALHRFDWRRIAPRFWERLGS